MPDPWQMAAAGMKGPSGQQTSAPAADPWAAAGGAVASAPQSLGDRIFGANPVSDTLSSIGTHLKNLVAGPYHAFTDAPRNPDEQSLMDAHGGTDNPVMSTLNHLGLGAHRMLVQPTVDAVKQSAALRKLGGPQSSLLSGSSYDDQGNNVPTAGSKLIDAIPIYGPWARGYADEVHQKGALPATAGLATDALAPMGVAKVLGGMVGPGGMADTLIRKPLTSATDEPMAGSTITPRQRFDSAQRLGVQLDAADATGSPALGVLKKINRDSLVGSPTYDAAAAKNVAAVRNSTGTILNDMSPLEPEQGGKLIQDQLRSNQAGLRNQADSQFGALDEATGGAPVPGAAVVGKTARGIMDTESPFYTKYPSFKPSTAMSALGDLSKVGDTASYSELQRLRSNTHELTTSNPDLVKDQGTGWLQRMTGTLDDAITGDGLTPEQSQIFRDANSKWSEMKSQYDDPSSPLFDAVRTPNPSKLSSGIGSKTPEMMSNLKPRLGEEGVGALQRGVTTDLLKNTATGDYDFKGFGRRLYGLPDAYRDSLFGPDVSSKLDDVARTTHGLGTDFNPSGSAKQLQKVGEGGAMLTSLAGHPGGLAPLLQYPLAKIMNSPGVVDWLMKRPEGGAGGPFVAPPMAPAGGAGEQGGGTPPVAPVGDSGGGTVMSKIGDKQVVAPDPVRGIKPVKMPVVENPGTSGNGTSFAGLDGGDTELHVPAGSMPAKYRVVDADSLTPSHDAMNFKPNPKYPEGVQERDYFSNKENQLRVIQNAQNYKPALTITDNADGINGPPVVNKDGVVLGGNSRVMSTQRLYNGDGSSYKDYLKGRANQFGVKPGDIDAMKKPMLVREVDTGDDVDGMRWLGSQLNKAHTGSLSASERAVSMGKGVSPATLQAVRSMLNEVGDGATLREVMADPARSNALLMRMQEDGIVGNQERGEFADTSTGGLNADGKTLFEKALMGTVLGDSKLMDSAPKHVLAKLNASIGPMAELGSRSDEWNILPALRKAIGEHGKMAASGIGVDDYLKQASVFDKPLTPVEEELTKVLGQNQHDVRRAFSDYGKDAQYSAPGQQSFAGPTAVEAFNHAFGTKLTPQQFEATK